MKRLQPTNIVAPGLLIPQNQPRDTLQPPPGSGKVCLSLAEKTDPDTLCLAKAHEVAMEDNPYFPDPLPSRDDFAATRQEFADVVAQLAKLRVEVIALTAKKDRLRVNLNQALTRRGQYVEVASNGNPSRIATSGLPSRRERQALGSLPWPSNFRAEVSQSTGQLRLRWAPVDNARSYHLQITTSASPTESDWATAYIGSRANCQLIDLIPGQTYYFRLATIGGKSGQSPWSPTISRLCA